MAKAKKEAALSISQEDAAKIQEEISNLEKFKTRLEKEKADLEKFFSEVKDANGNVIRRGPVRRIEILEDKIGRINDRLAELQASLTA